MPAAPDHGSLQTDAPPTVITQSRRSRRPVVTPLPLGSLTQRDHRLGINCRGCGSPHITRLTMDLTDGTPVEFISCHQCEHRTWSHAGAELSVDGVLARTRKS